MNDPDQLVEVIDPLQLSDVRASVGAPEFEFGDLDVTAPLVPEGTVPRPQRSLLVPVAVASAALAALLLLLGTTRDRPDPVPLADLQSTTTTAVVPVPDSLFVAQSRAGRTYAVRAVRAESPFVATETPDGFFGLRRNGAGDFVPMSSPNGIAWTTDEDSPISGVPDTFRPGARRWGPEPLQFVDGQFWGRFVSDRVAGASRAVLMLRSDDGITWQGTDGVPVTLDDAWFANILFRRPDDFDVRGGNVFALNPINDPLVFSVPDIDSADWQVVDVAAGSSGAALLFYDEGNLAFRVATTIDGRNWETTGLEEQGNEAVEIVLVGSDAVLLRAVTETGPRDLIVPLPDGPSSDDQTDASVRLVGFIPELVAPIGDIFVGLAGSSPDGEAGTLNRYVSDDGATWDPERPAPVEGLPDGAIAVGLWPSVQPGVLVALTDGDGNGLHLAASTSGVSWQPGPSLPGVGPYEPIEVKPTRTGLFLSVENRSNGNSRIEHYMWNLSTNELSTLGIGAGTIVTAAADSPHGLIIAVLSTDDPSAGTQFRLLEWTGEWTVLEADSELVFVTEIVTARFPIVRALSVGGVHETDWERLLDGDEEVEWQFVSNIGLENVGTFGLRDLEVGRRGAAALISPLDHPDRVTVLVTRDYETWVEVDIGLDERQSFASELIAINRNTVVVGGRSSSPFAAVVPLDGV